MRFLRTLKKNIINIPGWKTSKKIVVIESDDWGTVSMPSKEVYLELLNEGVPVDVNAFTQFDSLESEEDLNELFNVLLKYKDHHGNHPCITACTIMANPDFERIEEANMSQYFYEPFFQTYRHYRGSENVLKIWKQSLKDRLLWPQLHGREHLNPKEWLRVLRTGNESELSFFKKRALLGFNKNVSSKRFMGYLAAFDYEEEDDFADFGIVIKEAQQLFESTFGFKSKSFVAPTGIRSDRLDSYLSENGVEYHQMGQQFLPYHEARFAIRNRLMGSENKYGQIYWRRNGFFEPSRDARFDWVGSVLADMEAAFQWGKPFVISSHRVNFVGSLSRENRQSSLSQLDILLRKVIQKYPDVEFFSSDQLGNEIRSNPSYFMGIKFKKFYYDQKYKP